MRESDTPRNTYVEWLRMIATDYNGERIVDGASVRCEVSAGDARDIANTLEMQERELAASRAEVEQLQKWVNDLQSGMWINCVYCGHRYGPKESTPVSMADILKEHIGSCRKHPMSALKVDVERLTGELENTEDLRKQAHDLLIESMQRENTLTAVLTELCNAVDDIPRRCPTIGCSEEFGNTEYGCRAYGMVEQKAAKCREAMGK